ncbi:response regulator [Verticiella sediminum]|uniref:Response regulator n=1 Tax=Verticiella sediminum TaxID=1247510 RepID=A0A556AYK4_9BURK|nr:response regulator [Verticiella sediminum]TSH98024.1 response regulator [Verticiella sediminum]
MRGSIDYQAVFRAFPLPSALLTRDMIVVAANDAFLQLLEVKPQWLVGRSLFDCLQGMDPADVQPFRDALFAPMFHGRRESMVLRPGWPGADGQPQGARWRAVNVPMLGVTGQPEALLHCLVPPGYAALPGQNEVLDGQSSPGSLAAAAAFYTPASHAEPPVADAQAGARDALLIVSTDAARRELAGLALREAGYQVYEVDSAEAAMRCFDASPAGGLGLVFIDLVDGADTLARSAFAAIDDVEVLQATGGGAGLRTTLGAVNLARPYTAAQLLSQVRHLLRNREQRLLFREATAQSTTSALAEPGVTGNAAPESLNILLVEDSSETRDAARDLLELLGHQVTAVETAEAGLQMLAEGASFDVVCTDVSLPGMSGTALAMAVRQEYPEIGIVIASGYDDVAIDAAGLGAAVLPKPYSPESLEAALRAARAG